MDALEAAVRLNASLGELAAALAAPDADRLMAAEAGLAAALAAVPSLDSATPADRARVRAEVAQARSTLARCRILGASLVDTTRITLAASGHGGEYGRSGEPAPGVPAGSRGHHVRARL